MCLISNKDKNAKFWTGRNSPEKGVNPNSYANVLLEVLGFDQVIFFPFERRKSQGRLQVYNGEIFHFHHSNCLR